MSKKMYAMSILAILALNVNHATACCGINYCAESIEHSDIDIILTPVDRGPIIMEKIISAKCNVYNKTLNIMFWRNLGYGNIVVCHNGHEIINDYSQMITGDSVTYNLSRYGSGEYELVVTTGDGNTYVGTFSLVSQ